MTTIGPAKPSSGRSWRQLPLIRVFVALGIERTLRITAVIALIAGLGWVIVNARPWDGPPPSWIADAKYYYAAGERLNAGHQLYAFSPGDRVLDDPYHVGPFVYPPLIGVLWRPIAAFVPYDVAVTSWWATGLASFLGFLFWLLRRGGTVTALGVLVLLVPLAETAWSGNLSTFVTMGVVVAWLALQRRGDTVAGALIGAASVLKVTPVFACWWFVVQRRWRALAAAVAIGLVGFAIGALGAGVGSYFDYLRVSEAVVRSGGIQGSLVGILSALGVSPNVLPIVAPIVSLIGVAAVWALRRRERAAWAVAIATAVFASPVFNLTNVTLLLAVFVALDRKVTASPRPRQEPSYPAGAPAT